MYTYNMCVYIYTYVYSIKEGHWALYPRASCSRLPSETANVGLPRARGSLKHNSRPKGPCTQTGYTLASEYSLYRHIGAKV